MNAGGGALRALLLDGRGGARLALYYAPIGAPHPLGDMLFAPSFGEEMNRCRAMVSMQARALAAIGIGTLVLDPYGTGDSAGEHSEATWEQWREDLRAGIAWLREHGNGCRTLWGVRVGALMASELAALDGGIEQLVFWQPVVDGKQFFTQFLRIRIAAELEQNGGIKSTEELRKMAASGQVIEVSGYQVNGQLAREMDALKLSDASGVRAKRVFWCEVLPAADSNVPRANTKMVEAWQAGGVAVTFEKVVGPSFWQVHEREVAPDLITATTHYLKNQRTTAVASDAAKPASHAASLTETPITSATREYPVLFACAGDELTGMIHRGRPDAKRGVVIVVAGGPQYRAGAHRQFVSLARKLASRCGYPVLRFDLRGMGDSAGVHRGFQQSAADIRAAIDTLLKHEPSLESVVLLGECESASGILFYAYRDERAQGVVLVNPWVRTEGGRAEVIMKHYYWSRLTSKDFWRKVAGGQFNPIESLVGFFTTVRNYLSGRKLRRVTADDSADVANLPLPVKTAVGLRRFRGRVLILMSGNDYIAREFDEVIRSSQAWVGLLDDPRVLRRDLEGADHTFSREQWKRQASDWVCEWVASW
ncbi:MAG TPA: hydrolase 1, exosortase A system-associated [Steroidobacteraceae bacterium]|jgi:exosortase A-associated hydrolase 1/exosortase A-associated hydrolase 2|nr:hydrolase 1, exosortase A system-associated [Steroidobacteraceae bacterium]